MAHGFFLQRWMRGCGVAAALLAAHQVWAELEPAKPGVQTTAPTSVVQAAKSALPLKGQVLELRSGRLMTTRGLAPSLAPTAASAAETSRIAAVTFDVPVQQPVLDQLAAAGLRVLYPLPPNGAVVRGPRAALEKAAGLAHVYAIFALQAEQKIEAALARRTAVDGAARVEVVVYLHEDDVGGRAEARLQAAGLAVRSSNTNVRALFGSVPAGRVALLAGDDAVQFVDEVRVPQAHLNTSVEYSYAKGIRADVARFGQNIGVGIIDSGFLISHTAFGAQSGYPGLNVLGWNVTGDALGPFVDLSSMGHGTHVMATMMSRWASQAPGLDGVSPWIGGVATQQVRIVRCGSNTTLAFSGTITAINTLAADTGVQVVNNSWGISGDLSGASAQSILVDDATWTRGQLWVFSAGNDGNAGPTIGSPGAAKNVLAVGNVSNSYNATLAFSSSIGPTTDGRFKPEIYAPGDQVRAPTSAGGTTGVLALTGTSMSAPHVTAIAATLMDHHTSLQGRPALAKALMMASAQRLSNLTANPSIGLRAGRVHSERAHWGTSYSTYFTGYADGGVAHSATQSWDFVIPAGYERMYVALTWIEPAAPALSVNRVINDIDLKVDQGADGSDEFSSVSSVDNSEFVTVANPAAGTWRFKARGYSVSGANKLGLCVFLEKDSGEGPRPNPPTWSSPPNGSLEEANMTINTVADLVSGVQYFFDETSGIAGGSDSSWQSSTSYTDTGLHRGYSYAYRAKARDTSAGLLETGYSTTVVVNTTALLLSHNVALTDTRIPNRYRYPIFTNKWSVIAIASANDHDLAVAADSGFTIPMEDSHLNGSTRDFVAINGQWLNGIAYVEASYGVSDTYRVEAENVPTVLPANGTLSDTLNGDDIFDLFHHSLTNGQVVNLVLDQTFGSSDLALFLLPPDSNKLSRLRCSRVANATGASGDETYALTSTASGVWGVLVVNENGGYAEYDLKSIQPSGPSLSVSPSSRNFGSVLVGGYADLTFTVQNDGGGTLAGSASVSAPFSVASGGSYSLAGGASQQVTIRYSPTSAIGSTQTVSFTGGGGLGRTVNGLGYVTATPAISVSPPTASFGSVLIGTSATQTLVVANVGAGTLNGSATVAAPYALISGGSYSLGAGASQNVLVRFTPPASLTYNGTITFTGAGGATNGLTGSGYSNTPPAISVTPASHTYGSVLVGGSSDLVFAVYNTGAGTLSGSVSASAPYSLYSGGSYSLGSGQGQSIIIRYSPTSVGTHNQNLTFTGGAGAVRPVSGTGYTTAPPIIAVSPGDYSFDWVQVGSYTDRVFIVQNTGPGQLNGSATAIPPFWVVNGPAYSLAFGQSHTTTVRFMPVSGNVVAGYYLTFTGGPVPTNCILLGFGYNDTSDYDGDGFRDWAELRAGTGIYQPGSYLRTAGLATATNGGIRVNWDSVSGKYYRIIRSLNLPLASPTILTNDIPATSTNTSYLDTDAEGPGPHFYHLELSR